MNIDLIVDQNHTYRQAVEIAYEKAKRNGGVDALTEKCCQLVINSPYPASIYHEADMEQIFKESGDGGVFYKEWGHGKYTNRRELVIEKTMLTRLRKGCNVRGRISKRS